MRALLGVAPAVATSAVRLSDLTAANISGLPVAAAPGHTIGLTVNNGVATTWMRSDGAPALSVSIAPTWTGAHIFSALLTATLGISVTGSGSANALSVNGNAYQAVNVTNPGVYPGLAITGTSGSSAYINLTDGQSGAVTWQLISGYPSAGIFSITKGGSAAALQIAAAGNVTIAAPSSGVTLGLVGSGSIAPLSATDGTTTCQLQVANTAGSYFGTTTSNPFSLMTNNATRVNITAAGNLTINAPSSGVALSVSGYATATAALIGSGSTSTQNAADLMITRAGSTANSIEAGPNLTLYDTTNSTYSCLQNSGGQTELWQYNGGWNQILKVATTRGVTINTATSGASLTVSGNSGSPTTTGIATLGLQVSGGYGGGLTLIDGTYDWAFWDQAGTLYIGSAVSLGNASAHITLTPSGCMTINPPSYGNALTIAAYPSGGCEAIYISGQSPTNNYPDIYIGRAGSTANTQGYGASIQIGDSNAPTYSMLQHSGGQTEIWQYNGSTWAQRLMINTSGKLTLPAYGAGTLSTSSAGLITASDGRMKTKTRGLTDGIETVMRLVPTYYRWNADSPFAEPDDYEELGFIAQEVAAVIPAASPEPEGDKPKNFHDRAILAYLVLAVQELAQGPGKGR